ncbi:arylsulfatase J [Trichonephila clavata]|uniref:Arylsulfatase J n=2 Tax=Trichonephila clavata TaxID=2740835 RepID=A0A8X6GDM9_TRICU|nr:arylsulfatase J [Trichonephila clavata]
MVEKTEPEENERTYSVWPRIIAMFASFALVAVVFTVVGLLNTPPVVPQPELPHIIFILADDLGWNDVSFHGSPQIPTPNIDALAASGVILNNYYTHPQCTPSRGALMSGKYANRLGLHHGDLRPAEASGLPLNIAILPEYMKKMGYKSHMVGKWHLGYYKKRYLPTRRGFDSFFGFLNDKIDYYDYTCFYEELTFPGTKNSSLAADVAEDNSISPSISEDKPSGNLKTLFGIDLWENEEVIRDFRGEYATNVFTDKALDVIEDHNATKPLFLFVSHAASQAGNKFFPLQSPSELYERNNHIKQPDRRTYAGMVEALDDSVGRIFESLSQKDMLKNSIIVISSDNGGAAEPGSGSNWPLRGTKFSLWEGGVRSVGVVWSPLLGLEKPRVSMQLMHITDWLPTFYYMAGGDVDDLGDIDGMNMWPVIKGDLNRSPREEVLLNVDPISSIGGLRIGDMKILVSESPVDGSDWYGPSGLEDNNVTDSFDDWVWKNKSVVKDILIETDQWLLGENDTWRQDAAIICGENFLPISGKCDFTDGPCLYNITDDPCEYKNIASLYPKIVESMLNRLRDLNATSLPVQTKELDPLGDPVCHNFAHVPWMDEEDFDCPLS